MPLVQWNVTPSRKELRWFAALWWPIMCASFGGILFRRFQAPAAATVLWTTGGILALLGWLRPPVIRPLYVALIRLTFPIGWIVSHVVLAFVYYGILTPVGALVRIFHDPMERKFDRHAKSYWLTRQPPQPDRYFRQF
jgi:hypothetical protein